MAWSDDLLTVLSGGLPALVDGSNQGNGTTETNNAGQPQTVEQTPPEPQLQDKESFFPGLSPVQVYAGGAVLLGLIGLVFVARNW